MFIVYFFQFIKSKTNFGLCSSLLNPIQLVESNLCDNVKNIDEVNVYFKEFLFAMLAVICNSLLTLGNKVLLIFNLLLVYTYIPICFAYCDLLVLRFIFFYDLNFYKSQLDLFYEIVFIFKLRTYCKMDIYIYIFLIECRTQLYLLFACLVECRIYFQLSSFVMQYG